MYAHPADELGVAPAHLLPLDEARRRLRARNRPLAVLCVGASGRDALERACPGRGPELSARLLGLVEALPRTGELAAAIDGEDVVALLEATPAEAERAAQHLVESGRRIVLRPGEPPAWAGAHVGLAFDPLASDPQASDPQSRELFFETLVAVAQEGAAVARSRGGECVVHTRLYDLVQRRLERERGAPPSAEGGFSPAALNGVPSRGVAGLATPSPARAELPGAVHGAGARPEPGPVPAAVNAAELDDERLLPLARSIAAENVELMRRQIDERHREEISLLERRIQRLVASLEQTEEELRRLAELASVDPGVASTYRTIQGLSESEANYAKKRDLMSQILEANLELRRRIAESAA